jgi:ribonuclease J
MSLRILPLGGLGVFGMNLMIYEAGERIIVVDCGMMFPDSSTLGVDAIIPDMTYLFERADRIEGIFLTHGHEDHIGAVPFLVERVDAPVYGTPLTIGFVRDKLREFDLEAELRILRAGESVTLPSFVVEAVHVTHSIVDSVALLIECSDGVIVHTGDFKLDPAPIDGRLTDIERLRRAGERGVLALVSDSTNAIHPGRSQSESQVASALRQVFESARGRILVTTFASHIHRIQQIVNEARRSGRRVHLVGRSVVDNTETAERLGYLSIPREVRGDVRDDARAHEMVIITTGTQGEPTSALSRISRGEHKQVSLEEGDVVVISARTIPGNERAVNHLMDQLFRRGADVVYDEIPQIHATGHACRDELLEVIELTRPRFFIPMHGTYRHLVKHAAIAREAGIPDDRVLVIENGDAAAIDGGAATIERSAVPFGKVFIDRQAEEVADVVLRDRKHLAEDGFVIVVLALNLNTGEVVRDPEIITRGLLHVDSSADKLAEIRDLILSRLAENSREELKDAELVQEVMRATLKRYFRKRFDRRPMILPVVWEM